MAYSRLHFKTLRNQNQRNAPFFPSLRSHFESYHVQPCTIGAETV